MIDGILELICFASLGLLTGNLADAYSNNLTKWTRSYAILYVSTNLLMLVIVFFISRLNSEEWWSSTVFKALILALGVVVGFVAGGKYRNRVKEKS